MLIVTLHSGRGGRTAKPVLSTTDPAVVAAVVKAIRARLLADHPEFEKAVRADG